MSATEARPGRSTRVILEDALHEMHERERKLQPFVDELADVRKGIKTLERAIGTGPTRTGGGSAEGPSMADGVVALLGSADGPVPKETLADKFGGRGLHLVLASLVKSGRIVVAPGGYALPAPSREV